METVYVVITLNGRGFEFTADEMTELMGDYIFSHGGEVVAIFKKDAIAGYIKQVIEEEDYE